LGLTAELIEKLEKIYPQHVKSLNSFSKKLTDSEMKQLSGLLEKLSN
jgi:hypothetical protein